MSPLFAITLKGRVIGDDERRPLLEWAIDSSAEGTGYVDIGGGTRSIPLILSDGKLISLHYKQETNPSFITSPRDHIPFKLVTGQDWDKRWENVDFTKEPSSSVMAQTDGMSQLCSVIQ